MWIFSVLKTLDSSGRSSICKKNIEFKNIWATMTEKASKSNHFGIDHSTKLFA